jgi:hypothetical protein
MRRKSPPFADLIRKRPPKFQTETPPEAHIRAVAIGRPKLALYENRHRVTKLNAWKYASPLRYPMPGNRNVLFLIIGILVIAVGTLGYNLYQAKKEPEGLQINVGPNGLKIQNK